MGCDCGAKSSIEEKLREFINDLIITQISVDEYKQKLLEFFHQNKFSEINLLEKEFLNPLFESKTDTFSLMKHSFTNFIYKVKDKNIPFFLLSMAFLTNTIDFISLKTNYEIILYEILPEDLTKRIRAKNELVVFKKFLKYYVKLISLIVVEAYSLSFNSDEDKSNADYLKIVFNNAFINELIKRMFQEEKAKDFNIENFINKWYNDLKHNKVRENLHDIYMTSKNMTLIDDTSYTDFSDVVDEIDEVEEEDKISENGKLEEKEIFIYETNQEDRSHLEFINVSKINAVTRGFLYRKLYKKIKPELEKQTKRIHDYIKNNFTLATIKKTEEKRKIFYSKEGWKKFYAEDTKFFVIHYNDIHESKFLVLNNGSEYYSGSLNQKNQKHGFGISIERQGNKYTGYWYENMYHGWGELIDKNGNIFQGPFKYGILSGKGERYSNDEIHYVGEFENGMRQGEGKEDSEFFTYIGSFRKDKKNNKGKIILKLLKDTYEGDFLDDNITGKGEYEWSNGNIYVGDFLNGKMHGKGTNRWSDGSSYEGDYVKGVKEGHGRYVKANGKICEGFWKNGKLHGKAKLINEKGSFDVEFVNGKIRQQANQDQGASYDDNVF